jgi:hypothetical protein
MYSMLSHSNITAYIITVCTFTSVNGLGVLFLPLMDSSRASCISSVVVPSTPLAKLNSPSTSVKCLCSKSLLSCENPIILCVFLRKQGSLKKKRNLRVYELDPFSKERGTLEMYLLNKKFQVLLAHPRFIIFS